MKLGRKGIFVPVYREDGSWNSMMYGKIMKWFGEHPEYDVLQISPNLDILSILQQLSEISTR